MVGSPPQRSLRACGRRLTAIRVAAAVVVLATATASSVAAAPVPGGSVSVGVMGGYQLTSRDSDLLGDRQLNRKISDLPWAGLRVGVGLTDFLSIEAYGALNPGTARAHDDRAWVVQTGVEAIAHLLDGDFAIDLALGGGVASLVAGEMGTDTDFVATAGAGVRWVFGNRRLALRADVRATMSDAVKGPLAVGGVFLLGFDVFVARPDDEEAALDEGEAAPPPIGHQPGAPEDEDRDGVADADDACPAIPGSSVMAGCPDTDGDGMHDELDACPEAAGAAEFAGCPDSDGDGLPDTTDACPNLPGLEGFSGCPDSDDDGVPDGRDACPQLKGEIALKGCPGLPAEARILFQGALTDLRFEGESDRLRPEAQPTIARLAAVLVQYRHLNVEVRAHSHSKRSRKKAWQLSQRRADAVKRRLVDLGADARRLTAVGMGPEQPIASNKTRGGRMLNDRVELRLQD